MFLKTKKVIEYLNVKNKKIDLILINSNNSIEKILKNQIFLEKTILFANNNNIKQLKKLTNKIFKIIYFEKILKKNLVNIPRNQLIYCSINYIFDYIVNKPHIENNNLLWAHLHCYDINEFYKMYEEYLDVIKNNFNIIVTYSKGYKIPRENFCFLKIENKGFDIGAKFNCVNYLIKNKIRYSHILFLHSKKNKYKRKQYFDGILNNLDVNVLKNDIGIYTFDILITEHNDWGRNNYHMTNIIKTMDLPKFSNIFPEGNIYILNKEVAEYMYDNRFDIYKNLNQDNSFDYSWFINYYEDCKNLSYDEAYDKYKKNNLFGNNMSTKMGWYGLADCQIEHIFERIPFGVCKLLKKKIMISNNSELQNSILNNNINNNLILNRDLILIIACHTNSKEKIKYLVSNIKKFKEHIKTIYIVNSNEFKNLIEPYFEDDDSVIINNNLNDKQLNIYHNLFPDLKTIYNTNDELIEHYKLHGSKEYVRNKSFKKNINCCNINFEYTENTHLICHKKWYDCLKKLDLNNNFILTNDSFVLVNNIEIFINNFLKKQIDMYGIIDSYQNKYHLPDFLRIYSDVGIKLWIKYYEKEKSKCKTFLDIINIMEIGSCDCFDNYNTLFKVNKNYKKNIHFDDDVNRQYIENLNYPIIKIKRLFYTNYKHNFINHKQELINKIPEDFCPKFYKYLHNDFKHLSDEEAKQHFLTYGIEEKRHYKNLYYYFPDFDEQTYKNIHLDLSHLKLEDCARHFYYYGINEGRLYKKIQQSDYPHFISNKINTIKYVNTKMD